MKSFVKVFLMMGIASIALAEKDYLNAELVKIQHELTACHRQQSELLDKLARATDSLAEARSDWQALQNENETAALVDRLRSEITVASANYESLADKSKRDDTTIQTLTQELAQAREELDSLRKEHEQVARERDNALNYTSKPEVVGKSYAAVGGGHWVRKKIDSGRIILLEDGSLWQINSIDRIDTMLWLPTENIAVLEISGYVGAYRLVNSDAGDDVLAIYIGKQ